MVKRSHFLLFFIIYLFIYTFFSIPHPLYAAQAVKAISTTSVFIGENVFTLYGYTSPYARVVLEGQGIYDETYADEKGFFIFENRFSPLSSREACLTSYDTNGRPSQPVCLAPFPVKKRVLIGPVILSPSVSVNRHVYRVNDNIVFEGRSIPDSEVAISFFNDRQVFNIKTSSDDHGNFSAGFPGTLDKKNTAFATTYYQTYTSPKSNSITFDVLPFWKIIILKILQTLLSLIKNYATILTFATEGIILLLLLRRKRKKYPLALRPEHRMSAEA